MRSFQPFFTTTPNGQVTGLGLSLSYDITKAHGRKLIVETELERGKAFVIQLPEMPNIKLSNEEYPLFDTIHF